MALKLIPTELRRTKSGLSKSTKMTQKNAVKRVVAANDRRRPSTLSTMYAPSYVRPSVRRALKIKVKTTYERTRASTERKDDHVP